MTRPGRSGRGGGELAARDRLAARLAELDGCLVVRTARKRWTCTCTGARAVAAGGGESARAERLTRWHAEDQAGSEAAGCDDGFPDRCAHLEAAAR